MKTFIVWGKAVTDHHVHSLDQFRYEFAPENLSPINSGYGTAPGEELNVETFLPAPGFCRFTCNGQLEAGKFLSL